MDGLKRALLVVTIACGALVACTDGGAPKKGAANGAASGIDPSDPGNATRDRDCDGLSDADELSTRYAGGRKTDPEHADTDGDGILDGIEAGREGGIDLRCTGRIQDADPGSRTNPTDPDSDADDLLDGAEDADRDGRLDEGESDPKSRDSDDDGLPDGEEARLFTQPTHPDSDGDGLSDGVEARVTHTS